MTAPPPLRAHRLWHRHPGVRSGGELTFGERAADRMKSMFATWTALFAILLAMCVWIWTGGFGADKFPFILLNLCLSCLAALQCFILLIAAKRSDQTSAELAMHTYENGTKLLEINKGQTEMLAQIHAMQQQLAELRKQP